MFNQILFARSYKIAFFASSIIWFVSGVTSAPNDKHSCLKILDILKSLTTAFLKWFKASGKS